MEDPALEATKDLLGLSLNVQTDQSMLVDGISILCTHLHSASSCINPIAPIEQTECRIPALHLSANMMSEMALRAVRHFQSSRGANRA